MDLKMMTCSYNHARRSGFTEVNGWWLCGDCFLPAPLYARSVVINNAVWGKDGAGQRMGLIVFEGGPLDQHAYDTATLLSEESLVLPIIEYVWTSEKRTSERTGAVAQIWRHKTMIGDSPTSTVSPAVVAAMAAQEYSEAHQPPAPIPPTAPEPAAPAAQAAFTGAAGPEDETANVATVTSIAPAAESASGGADSTDLTARRKALKLSVKQVSDATGLAASKIINIEKGTGARVKDEERQTLASYITSMEQGAPASAHA